MTPSEAHKVVSSVGWLSRQSPALQNHLLAGAELMFVAAGDRIYGLDAPPGGIFGLAGGLVDVLVAPGPFPTRLVHIARPGWWVGEAAAATGTRRRAELMARTDVWVLHVSPSHLSAIEADVPDLWKCLAAITVQHLDDALFLRRAFGATICNFGLPARWLASPGQLTVRSTSSSCRSATTSWESWRDCRETPSVAFCLGSRRQGVWRDATAGSWSIRRSCGHSSRAEASESDAHSGSQ